MSLEKWVEYGWLRREPTSPGEIKDLLGIVERSLADSRVEAYRPTFDSSLPSPRRSAPRRLRSAPRVIAPSLLPQNERDVRRIAEIERGAYYCDLARIVGASGNQLMATCLGESEQDTFKSSGRPAFERGSSGKKPSHLPMGTPHGHSRRHVPNSRSRRATLREIEVLSAIAAGNANQLIADKLAITEETFKGHVKNILSKLGANDRTHAITIGLKRRIIEL
jgi:DNA-binding CsgD family transcriptional regulator